MKISELIVVLEGEREKRGDVEVWVDVGDGRRKLGGDFDQYPIWVHIEGEEDYVMI